jgi:hypothetical protein
MLTSLGATHVHPRDTPLTPAVVSAITPSPITLVFDALGLQAAQQAGYEVLAPGGKLITVDSVAVDKSKMAEQGRQVAFIMGMPHSPPNREFGREMYKALSELLATGLVKVRLQTSCVHFGKTYARPQPNRVEVLPGGLQGIPDGLTKLQKGEVRAAKLVAHPLESD